VEVRRELRREIPPEIEALLYDPQTSGGLLIALAESDAAKFTGGYRIGRVLPRTEKAIRLI
jgi:selenophosphate synthase